MSERGRSHVEQCHRRSRVMFGGEIVADTIRCASREVHTDLAWGYDTPLAESAPVAGRIAFHNEKVEIVADGIPQDQPQTVFS